MAFIARAVFRAAGVVCLELHHGHHEIHTFQMFRFTKQGSINKPSFISAGNRAPPLRPYGLELRADLTAVRRIGKASSLIGL